MVTAMSSQHHRNRGADHDNNDEVSSYESNNQMKRLANNLNNLRRRHNATTTDTGEYRVDDSPIKKKDDEASIVRRPHLLPKSLTPFVHINDTAEIDAALSVYTNRSSPIPKHTKKVVDVEAQQLNDIKSISYDQEDPFHASNLSMDSYTDFNNSKGSMDFGSQKSPLFNDYDEPLPECNSRSGENLVDDKKMNTLKDPPSVGGGNSASFRRKSRKSYDTENGDERGLSSSFNVDSSGKSGTDTGSNKSDDEITSTSQTILQKIQQSRRIVGKCVNNEYVQITIIILIVLNAILMGFSTTKMVTDNTMAINVVEWVDRYVFLVIFSIEIFMQFYYFGFALFLDWWLVFDVVVVGISWMSVEYQVVRSFRIFRAFRLITRVRPLRDLVLALGEVLPKMSAIVALLLVTFYVFAVLFTELFSEYELKSEAKYFSTLWESIFTCFQMMTMEWIEICRELMEHNKHAWVPIVAFVALAGFIVFNLIVAVVVEAVAATEETVRQLDGLGSNSPASKLFEAQERIDLLQSHVSIMTEQQEQIQFMLETMAGELLHMETERMKAKYRENRLLEEIKRREDEKNKAEKPKNDAIKLMSMRFLQKIEASKAERNKQPAFSMSEEGSNQGDASAKKRRGSMSAYRNNLVKDGSGKSLGTASQDSACAGPDQFDSPNQKSTKSTRQSLSNSSSRGDSLKGKFKRAVAAAAASSDQNSEKTEKKRAMANWKKLLAVQKDFDL